MGKQWLRSAALAFIALAFAGCTAMTGQSAEQRFDDAGITAAVKSKLIADRTAALTDIDVDTVNGTVYLIGTAPNGAAKQRAAALARQVDGVVAVENNLQTQSATTAGDAPQ